MKTSFIFNSFSFLLYMLLKAVFQYILIKKLFYFTPLIFGCDDNLGSPAKTNNFRVDNVLLNRTFFHRYTFVFPSLDFFSSPSQPSS